jgi:diguanylate cyclase (GGDEF)-like protein/putative nucleotidyltransferase with HDIG domain
MGNSPAIILIVEDNLRHQTLLERTLRNDCPDIQLHIANNGEEFGVMIQKQLFDCVVMDYNLPPTNAMALIATYRSFLVNTPVLVISSDTKQETVINCLRSGSIDYVPKSQAFNVGILWERIACAIKKNRQFNTNKRILERRRNALIQMAETDSLTGLSNRHYLNRLQKEQAFQHDRRRSMSCIMIDIDYFKKINDTYGHFVGDGVLKACSAMITLSMDSGEHAIRWGGEEFLILRSSVPLWDTWEWAECLREKIAATTFTIDGQTIRFTVSMGIHWFPTATMGDAMINLADKALYLAKTQGRNRVCTSEMFRLDAQLQQVVESSDRSPLGRWGHLMTLYQDQLALRQKQHVIVHCKAVARIAAQIAQAMELAEDEKNNLRLAGLLHDIGKSLIPEELLGQAEPLSPRQKHLMQCHVPLSMNISERLGSTPAVTDYIQYHHRFYNDGNGRNAPKLGADIIGVADAVSAMTSERSYHKIKTIEEAMAELRKESGKQFNPAVVASLHLTGMVPRK